MLSDSSLRTQQGGLGLAAAVAREANVLAFNDVFRVVFYLALAKAWNGHPAEAVPLFKAALLKEDNAGIREEYQRNFVQAMVQAGKPLDAYAAVTNAREAFRIMAAELMKRLEDGLAAEV